MIVPMSLDYRVPTPRDPSQPRPAWEVSSNSFHSIGGNSIALSSADGPPASTAPQASTGMAPSPFASTLNAQRRNSQKMTTVKRIQMLRMLPSQVGDVDMLRIREAEKVVRII